MSLVWENWEQDIVRSHATEMTAKELAALLPRRSPEAIAKMRRRLGIAMSAETTARSNGRHNLVGRRFGRLVVERAAGIVHTKSTWSCRCDCGKGHIVPSDRLLKGVTASCGCLNRELSSARFADNHPTRTHGLSRTPEYRAWKSMMGRCYNSKDAAYPRYGGRGIVVCKRWHTFENFLADMKKRPTGLSLDRLNNDGNYEPSNCEWRTEEKQQNNRRDNVMLTLHGKTLTAAQWSRERGIAASTIRGRLSKGWSDEQTLTTPGRAGARPLGAGEGSATRGRGRTSP